MDAVVFCAVKGLKDKFKSKNIRLLEAVFSLSK